MTTNYDPFAILVGTLDVYIAPAGETPPAVNTTPAGNWLSLGYTDGDQAIEHAQTVEYKRVNETTGPLKSVRTEEDHIVTMTLVNLTLETYARVLENVANVATVTGPPHVRNLPLKRGASMTRYALLLKGTAHSPYGNYPAQVYVPITVIDGSPKLVRTKSFASGLEVEFHALEDDSQATGYELGWMTAQDA